MPTYDYVCITCGHRMEVVHGVHDRGPALCPVCGGQVKKAFSAPAVLFKGTGWAKKERLSSSSVRHKSKDSSSDASTSDGTSSSSPGPKTGESGSTKADSGASSPD